jgi:hypothetical protein
MSRERRSILSRVTWQGVLATITVVTLVVGVLYLLQSL